MHTVIQATHRRQHGMTLIETMVAMTISSVLILGSIQMHAQARSSYRTTESVARMQENLRFSIDILDEDVRLAGYWGKSSSANAELRNGETVTVTCNGTNSTAWVLDTEVPNNNLINPISALQQESDLPIANCRGTNPRINSDVLIVRHATTDQAVVARAGVIQIQTNGRLGAFFDNGIPPEDAKVNGQIFDLAFSAYYVSNESKYDSNLPSLRRLSLVNNQLENQEIIPGVENLQVQFGIDRTGDGTIDMYINGDAVLDGDTIISTRLWLLVRSEQNEAGQGYFDAREYLTPDAGLPVIDPKNDTANYPPTSRRTALSRTIVMRNHVN
ncbi:MAG: PilW family protein [Gammaproteobacteria bacterium]|nr:PilW family protein [Gammaproteobacteria bacterium]